MQTVRFRSWRGLVGVLAAAAALCLTPARAAAGEADAIARAAAPAWVIAHEIPKLGAALVAQSSDGIAWLLLDTQFHAEGPGYAVFQRDVKRVIDRGGLEAAGAVRVEFDPRDETVTLNHVRVIRGGQVIDHTADLGLQIIRRESDLDDGLTDGRVTAVGDIPDVRVGDTVDFAVTIRTTSPLWPGQFFRQISTRWSVPMPLRVVRITWPSDRPIVFRAIDTDAVFSRKTVGADTVYELVQRDAPAETPEQNVPSWKPAYGLISMSTMSSWREVAAWALALYQGDDSLGPEFSAEVDAIAARWRNPADRLTEAARLVQDRIRYVGVEIGDGSFVPRRPAEVVRKGYGDCKDKSLLLAVVLRRLGVQAAPALVATGWGQGLPEWAPSPVDFDHVIVRAELDGKPVWIDPTLDHQGGRGAAIATPDYGWVLPIRPDQQDLERIVVPAPTLDQQHVVEHFEVSETGDPAVRLKVETTYRDGAANRMRASMATQPVANLAKHYLDYYLEHYPGIVQTKSLAVEDDRDANVLRTVETYALPRAAFDEAKLVSQFPIRADAVLNLLPPKQNTPRRNALFVPANLRRTHVVELGLQGRRPGVLPDVDQKGGGVEFKRTTRLDGDTAVMTFTLTTGAEAAVPATRTGEVYALIDTMQDEAYLEFHIDRSDRSLGAALGVPPEELAPFEPRIRQVGELLGKTDQPSILKALTLLNAMSGEVRRPSPTAGLIDGLKGLVLTTAGRYAAAEAALESSAGQYHGNAQMLQVLAALQFQDRKLIEAVHTLQIEAEHHPDQIEGVSDEFVRGLRSGLFRDHSAAAQTASDDLAILLAEAGWRRGSPKSFGEAIRAEAIRHLLERGRNDDARKLVAAGPLPSEAAAALAVDDRYRAVWPDLDAAVRDHFRTLVAQDLARSTAALAKSPDDFRLLTLNLSDLRRAGEPETAVRVGKAAVADRGRIEAAGEDGFWFANGYADALFDAGRHDEALALMDWLVGLGLDRYPSLVSQAINRAEMLLAAGRPAEALAAYDALDGASASAYGKMWIWAGSVCAAHAVGKADIVKAAMTKLEDQQDDNRAAMARALACLGDGGRIEALLVRRLDDPRDRGAVLPAFSDVGERPRTRYEQDIAAAMDAALKSPAVQAKFKAYGRAVTFDGRPTSWGAS